MSLYTDFDADYGDYHNGIPAADGTVDILNGGTVVDNINVDSSGMVNGDFIFETPNIDGGFDTFVNGAKVSYTQPNVYGGEDTFEETTQTHTTIPNEHDGYDIYGQDFHHEGTTFANVYGTEDYLSDEGNSDEILLHEDPLRFAQNLKFSPLNMSVV